MEFRKLIFVLAVTSIIIFGLLWGSTYAYYVYTGGPEINVTTASDNTRVSVVFTQSKYMNLKTGVPISEADIDNYAGKTVFTLVPDSASLEGYDVAITISLYDLKIDSELMVSDLKYDLKCTDGSNTKTLISSNGSKITSSTKVLTLGTLSTVDSSFDINKTYTCTLRAWLQDSGVSQNKLMYKNFSGTIKVDSIYKK